MPGGRGRPPLVVLTAHEEDAWVALVHEALVEALERDVEVARLPSKDAGAARADLLRRADALLAPAWHVEDHELDLLGRVKVVQSVWAGMDRLPLERLGERLPQAWVASGSGPNAPQVAEHAVGLLLACTRRLVLHDRAVRRGAWTQDVAGRRVAGSHVAVVGSGAIGRRVARMLVAMDAEVTLVNRTGRSVEGLDALDLAGLCDRRAEFHAMVLALPLTPQTRGFVDQAWLRGMREDAVLVNVGRGKLIVEDDLYAHLVAHPEFHVGLDVWWHYPKQQPRRFAQAQPFERLDNVVATPHVAFNVPGSRAEMFRHASANVARVLAGQEPRNVALAPRSP